MAAASGYKKIRSAVRILKIKMVVGDGFEPSKAWPVDLQSTAFDRSATPPEIALGAGRGNRTLTISLEG